MLVFELFIVWIVTIAVLALGTRSGSHSSGPKPLSYEEIEARDKAAEDMVRNMALPEGKRVISAYYIDKWREYHAKVEYQKDGEKTFKIVESKTLWGLRNEIMAL